MTSKATSKANPAAASQSGFTLIEVLVAMVVLAVGMLGIAGLYIEGLRSGSTSIARTAAVEMAADMADRIRSNPNAGAAYAAGGPGSANQSCVSNNGGTVCTPAQLAEDDWFWWLQSLNARMSAGSVATVAVDTSAAPITRYTIQISWPEIGQRDASTYTMVFAQ